MNGYEYSSTVAVYGSQYLIPLNAAHRQASGLKGGDEIEVTLELDLEPRRVELPEDLAQALEATNARAAFDKLAFSKRKEAVRQLEDAKTPETRTRRLEKIVAGIKPG